MGIKFRAWGRRRMKRYTWVRDEESTKKVSFIPALMDEVRVTQGMKPDSDGIVGKSGISDLRAGGIVKKS